jgi:mRNA-degrading endonuclease RelE of RelBE toxin-antitoxin system
MPHITLRPSFSKDLDGLKRSSRKHYQKACEILMEIQRDIEPTAPRRAETRIPKCTKYELPDGHRLVLQRGDSNSIMVALVVGTHDHVESFLDGHKGSQESFFLFTMPSEKSAYFACLGDRR